MIIDALYDLAGPWEPKRLGKTWEAGFTTRERSRWDVVRPIQCSKLGSSRGDGPWYSNP
jgi:hypothetical protein